MLQRSLLTAALALLGVLGWAAAELVVSDPFITSDTIPGYVHRTGAGSRVDVRADGLHDGDGWTLLLKRNLQTGDSAHDIQFATMGTYYFQVTTWDNSGDANHSLAEAGNIYWMQIPVDPGPLVFSGTPGIFEELSGELLSSGEIEITVRWLDATRNDSRKRWMFDGSDWSQSSENEDRLAIIWDLQGDQFVSAGTCADMCHLPDRMYTAPGTFVDTWQWKGTRTNPAGYADDKWWNDGNLGTASGRHSDSGQAPYKDNVAASPPTYMAEGDPGANARFLFDFLQGTMDATAWQDGAWNAGDTLSAYVGRPGSGSRADTRSTSTHDGDNWNVTFRRKLDTGDPAADIIMQPGGSYDFQVTVFDNTGDAGHSTTEMLNVFSMTIPASPGPLAFSATPSIFTSLSGSLLDSEEIEVSVTWPDSTRNDVRKQWSFDGSSWSQSSENEDRVAFIWDMQGDGFLSSGNCASMCHLPDRMYTNPGTFVDVWHWKGSRTGAFGFTDDKWWNDGNNGAESGRHSDQGTSVYRDNSANNGAPSFMSALGPGFSARYLYRNDAAAGWQRAVPFNDAGGPPNICEPGPTTLCFNDDRFEVEVSWKAPDASTGAGAVVPGFSDNSGNLWFFSAANWEMLVKVLNGCAINNHYWVFFAATTDVEFTLSVTDLESGTLKEYTNPQGQAANAITDTTAFATCP